MTRTPHLAARQLGRILRELRIRKGLSQSDIYSPSARTIMRYENAYPRMKLGADRGRVLELCRIYEADEATTNRCLHLAEATRVGDRWDSHVDMPEKSLALIDFEDVADRIWLHDSVVIPALLQTPRYIDAIFDDNRHFMSDPATVKSVRMRRQEKFFSRDPIPETVFLVGESALLCAVGGEAARDEQIEALLAANEYDNIEIRVIALSSGYHRSMGSEYTILGFDDPMDVDTVYLPARRMLRYLSGEDDVQYFKRMFDDSKKISTPIEEFLS